MPKNKTEIMDRGGVIILGFLVLSVILLLLDSIKNFNGVRNGISFIFEPVSYAASNLGTNIKSGVSSFSNFSKLQKDYNQLKIESYDKDINNAYFLALQEENNSLKTQINLGNKEKQYVLAKVVGSSLNHNFLNLNVGSKDGVKLNDTVSIGNMYVGQISSVDLNGSVVRLMTSKNSTLEVIITRKGVENAAIADPIEALSRAVVTGSPDGIKIENISTTADIKDGDIVVINDSRIGEYLVLGYIVGLTNNPADTSRSGYVSAIIDYDNLMTVFVKTE